MYYSVLQTIFSWYLIGLESLRRQFPASQCCLQIHQCCLQIHQCCLQIQQPLQRPETSEEGMNTTDNSCVYAIFFFEPRVTLIEQVCLLFVIVRDR